MIQTLLADRDWDEIVGRLGGADALELSARETNAFLRGRVVASAVDLLRLILAYCLGTGGLRSTAAWAAAAGLVDISAPALLYRLRQSGDWLTLLIGRVLASAAPAASRGRLVRLVDGTTVRKAGKTKETRGVWRIHSAFDLPSERFGFFELTDEHGGETIDRIPVVKGEIRVGDRAFLQPDRIATVIEAGADVVVRAPWRNASWRDASDKPLDLTAFARRHRRRGDRSTDRVGLPGWSDFELAPGRGQKVEGADRSRQAQGPQKCPQRPAQDIGRDPCRCRMGHADHFAGSRKLLNNRCA
jgi:hypothetical protein